MEDSIFKKALDAVQQGAKFRVDLEKRSLLVGKHYLVKDGKYEGKLSEWDCFSISALEYFYQIYKHSRPSERSDAKRRTYFIALPENELSDDDMLYGNDREISQLTLEFYLLCWILSGTFIWDEDEMGRWFWQSNKDKDLVILRSWVENKEK